MSTSSERVAQAVALIARMSPDNQLLLAAQLYAEGQQAAALAIAERLVATCRLEALAREAAAPPVLPVRIRHVRGRR